MLRQRREAERLELGPFPAMFSAAIVLVPLVFYGVVFVDFLAMSVKPQLERAAFSKQRDVQERLNLAVVITKKGFSFKVNSKYRLPWMSMDSDKSGQEPDIRAKKNDWNYDELNRRLREIKAQHREETQLILRADDEIRFEVLIKVMNFSEGTETEPLFPDVTLARTGL